MPHPFAFRAAQVVGISGAAWLGGNIAATSLVTTPALLRSHREDKLPAGVLIRQWRNLFEQAKVTNASISAACATVFLYLAWSVRSGAPLFKKAPFSRSGLFSTAAVLTVGIVPYTLAVMNSTNTSLLEKANSTSDPSDAETSGLLEKWTTLNKLRSVFPLTAAVCGLLASFV
ncbi:uncharacterized protein N7459_009340 [Penicillium hispanicum]|uniref:uncharacterized protein n=1 Tax=Penicillium hispanicum TaxID=1080232 RepID=UPI002541D3E1|nr:uncharacterized protein N7459_009340 [Penicillium hispanicum]KAJ5569910.1 hypothetical protein N7459_009340 [Penicillium hispanicum]